MNGHSCWKDWLEAMGGELTGKVSSPLPRIADNVIRRADIRPGHRVLDIGAGTGLVTLRAARAVGPDGLVIAIDSDTGCIEQIASDPEITRDSNVETVVGSIEELPFSDGEFDAVVCRSAIVYTSDMSVTAGEIVRALKPGGRFSLYEPMFSEARYRGHPEEAGEDFLEIDHALRSSGGCRIDREKIRNAFENTGNGFDSMVEFTEINMEERDPEEIYHEYLFDMPGELAAFNILRKDFDESLILKSVRNYAKASSEGKFTHIIAGIYLWGVKE